MLGRVKYNVMNDQELSYLKGEIERLLIERGVILDHEEMLDDLAAVGCVVDKDAKEVKFTKELIDKAMAAVPEKFTLYSPGGERDLDFPSADGRFYTRTNTGAPNYRTIQGDTHYTTLEEVEEWYKLTNAMENLDFVTLPSTSGEYVPGDAVDVYTLEKALKLSAKHIWIQPYEADNVQYLIDMAAAAVGGLENLQKKPTVSFIACSVPCLTYKHMDAEILYRCAKAGVPVQPCSLPTAGANTPVTAQGTAFMACAEVLAMIIMLELLCPGLPVIATPLLFSMDMMTTYTLQSNTEITIARLIAMELFENGYNVRAHSYGTGTDSLCMDAQNFIERTSLTDAMAMSAASVLGGAGQLETAKTISPVQLIIDNEIFGIAQRIRRGLDVDVETIDADEIFAALDKDPSFSFLMSEHTGRHFMEPHRPELFNRDGVVHWESEGCKTLEDKALEKFHTIMDADSTYALEADKAAAVEAVLKAAHTALVKE
ncbi:trimethylamine methyltransferase family protein [Eubacterium aggregans]|uniref:trimethylamine methyltransferase family protein n=1 Tax=Eubacterium aggregans TaxID=81409 RepID=UPI0023F413C9|nr:trimethylamine methyltransferase family protein [Eubacterium aggregans]MDD4692538.1 trimethylamine methyltransferase family protein [Eubacterium aggregans]